MKKQSLKTRDLRGFPVRGGGLHDGGNLTLSYNYWCSCCDYFT